MNGIKHLGIYSQKIFWHIVSLKRKTCFGKLRNCSHCKKFRSAATILFLYYKYREIFWSRTKPSIINKNTGNVRITQNSGAFVLPLLQWRSNRYYIFWVCVCSLRYTARNAHAPYCHLWPAGHPQYFTTLSHKRHD